MNHPTIAQAQADLKLFAEQADLWELAAVFLYMDLASEPQYHEIFELSRKWIADAEDVL